METTTQAYLEQKFERIQTVKQQLQSLENRQRAFQRFLYERYTQLQQAQSSTEDYIATSFTALYSVLQQPELVERTFLVSYVSEIMRLVENAGLGFQFGKVFIDRVIEVYRKAGYSLMDLYLAKANFLRLDKIEDVEREAAFLAARHEAEQSEDRSSLVRVLMRLAEYYTEVSQYKKSLDACYECECVIESDGSKEEDLHRYMPRVQTNIGMNYTSLFRYEMARRHFLQAKSLLEQDPMTLQGEQREQSIYPGKRTMATILHYLGRIAEATGNLQEAIAFYVEGDRYQQMCPRELSASAFYHLRLGELLTSAHLLEQARYHIRISQTMFDDIDFSSSGRVLVGLAWASIYSQEGKYTEAKRSIQLAQKEAKEKKYPRGELLCYVKLFWLELWYRHMLLAVYTLLEAMIVASRGELRRGGLSVLKWYLSQVLLTPIKLLQHSPHSVMGAKTFHVPLTGCGCPVHREVS